MSNVDATVARTPPKAGKSRRSRLRFDDRVDTETEISAAEAAFVLIRAVQELGRVKTLFAARFLLSFGTMIPTLLLPWVGKIVIDNVLLGRPLGETEGGYPPFMDPILAFLTGMGPLEIMLALTVGYVVLQFFVGLRTNGIEAELFEGSDAPTQSENQITDGGSRVSGVWGLVEFWVSARLTQRLANGLRTRLLGRLTKLPLTTLDDQRFGDSIYRVMYDAPSVWDACTHLTLHPFHLVLSALINLYLMQYVYGAVAPQVVWVAWAALPVTFFFTSMASGLMRRVNQVKRAAGAAATNAMEEAVNNIGAVQSLGGMQRETSRFAERSAESFLRERFALIVDILVYSILVIVTTVGAIYVTIVVTDRIIEGEMSPGDFLVLFLIYSLLVESATQVGAFWAHAQEAAAALRRVFFFLDYESDEDHHGDRRLGSIRHGVAFEDVAYTYPDGQQALDRVNLDLAVGELVALVGPTGAGKTSLAYLIPSFLIPTRGRVLIDGQDTTELDLDTLRSQVAYVFQEHLLLSESVRENLLLANPAATAADMADALRTAGCTEFIDALPNGIDTVLGRSGDTLSVGQQQRLSIARGIIRDARILILDEPTAALDPGTEKALVDVLHRASKDRLVLVIAHRLSTIRRADRIVFLEDGVVKDVGSHEALMENPASRYRRFVELQGTAHSA